MLLSVVLFTLVTVCLFFPAPHVDSIKKSSFCQYFLKYAWFGIAKRINTTSVLLLAP